MGDQLETVVIIDVAPDSSDYDHVVDVLWQFGTLAVSEVETNGRLRLTAAYAEPGNANAAQAQLAGAGATLAVPDDGDWVANWRSTEPVWEVGGFWLRLPEHPTPAGELMDLMIEPSSTFGFSHPSTRLALELLAGAPVQGASVGDIGCGSGVLGIAAAKLGATEVYAVDIDVHAVEMTAANATTNGVAIQAEVGSIERLSDQLLDTILLNVTAGTSFPMANAVSDLARPGATLILSGLLRAQRSQALAAFASFALQAERVEGDWVALRLERLG